MSTRQCPCCGEYFSGYGLQKYCSPECGRKYRAGLRSLRDASRIFDLDAELGEGAGESMGFSRKKCLECGKLITPISSRAGFCSRECRDKSNRDRMREIQRRNQNIKPKYCKNCGKELEDRRFLYCPDCRGKKKEG